MKNLIILALVLLLENHSVKVYSQEVHFAMESGLGSYKMDDFRELNEAIVASLPFNAAVIENFPAYWYYKPSLTCKINKIFTAGLVWSYASTGSRVSSKDYSGKYTFDNVSRASSPGILIEAGSHHGKIEFAFFAEAGMEFTKLKLSQSVTLNTDTMQHFYSFSSINYYVEPGIRISYPVSVIRFSFNAGYLFDLSKGGFSYEGDDNQILQITADSEAKANWTGIRIGLSAAIRIFQKENPR